MGSSTPDIRGDRANRRTDGLAGRSCDAERCQHSALCVSRLDRLPNSLPACLSRTVAWRESWLRWRGRSALKTRLPVYDGYWRFGDPMPSLAYYATEAGKVAGQMT